jgi:hypothetical protein
MSSCYLEVNRAALLRLLPLALERQETSFTTGFLEGGPAGLQARGGAEERNGGERWNGRKQDMGRGPSKRMGQKQTRGNRTERGVYGPRACRHAS